MFVGIEGLFCGGRDGGRARFDILYLLLPTLYDRQILLPYLL